MRIINKIITNKIGFKITVLLFTIALNSFAMETLPYVNFFLKDKNADSKTPILVVIRKNGDRIVKSTGEVVSPSHWDSNKRRVKNSTAVPDNGEINFFLDKTETEIKSICRNEILDQGKIDFERLKDLLELKSAKTQKKQDDKYRNSLNKYISEVGLEYKQSTVRSYEITRKHLEGYEKYYGKTLTFNSFDLTFFKEFKYYTHVVLGHRIPTFNKNIKNIKAFLNDSLEKELHNNMKFKSKKFRQIREDFPKIYLDVPELGLLKDLVLKEGSAEKIIRDLFLVGAFTGLRFSDYTRILPENISDNNGELTLKISSIKTRNDVIIPIHPVVRKILTEYNFELPKTKTNAYSNRILKELGKRAGINESHTLNRIESNNNVVKTYKKYECITTHCARRSFATNSYLSGIPSIAIMAITGHTTEKAFLGYIRVTRSENATNLRTYKFFQDSN